MHVLHMSFHLIFPREGLHAHRTRGFERLHIMRRGHVSQEVQFLLKAFVTALTMEPVYTQMVIDVQAQVELTAELFATLRAYIAALSLQQDSQQALLLLLPLMMDGMGCDGCHAYVSSYYPSEKSTCCKRDTTISWTVYYAQQPYDPSDASSAGNLCHTACTHTYIYRDDH